MKIVGIILILLGGLFFALTLWHFFQNDNTIVSPLPQQKGVKVILITPSN